MKQKNHLSVLGGIAAGGLAWVLFMIADAIDEFILDYDSFLGFSLFFTFPIALLVLYLVHFFKQHPSWKKLLVWHGCYVASFGLILLAIQYAFDNDAFIIPQYGRGDWLNLNGIEYLFYGVMAVGAFLVLCILFHIGYVIVKFIRNSAHKKECIPS